MEQRMRRAACRRLLEITFELRGLEADHDLYRLPLDSPEFERWCKLRSELFELREHFGISEEDDRRLTR